MLTDQQLKIILHGCHQNERKAQQTFYQHYFNLVMAMSWQYASQYDEAILLTNDIFLVIFREMINPVDKTATVPSFSAWLGEFVLQMYLKQNKKSNSLRIAF